MGALGSAITRHLDGRARFLGSLIYFGGGVFFAIFYGWVVLALMRVPQPVPQIIVLSGLPTQINLFYPILGVALGLGHGILVAFIMTIIVIEHHPLEQFRTRFILVISQLISHIAFGITVMFFPVAIFAAVFSNLSPGSHVLGTAPIPQALPFF